MINMTVNQLHQKYDLLQRKHGPKELDAIYGAGCTNNPKVCFTFMNPTARNIASQPTWKGLKAPWIGTKSVWKLFYKLGFIEEKLFRIIRKKKPEEWDYEFTGKVYEEIRSNQIFITNLAKCTQEDARHLSNEVFRDYKALFEEEIQILDPQIIVTFGNQVSSVFLDRQISVSKVRRKKFEVKISESIYPA
jgi:DNA polymerase